MIIKNKTKKFISFIFLILIIVPTVLFSRPKKANADCAWANTPLTPCFSSDVILEKTEAAHTTISMAAKIIAGITSASTVINTGHTVENALIAIAKQAVMVIEQRLLQEMTKSTVNWINSGFHGAPLFLQNPTSFFQDIAKFEVKTLVDEFGYDINRFPFGKSFALNTINAYKSTADADAQYSLYNVIRDPVLLHNYQNNFNTGGWNGFFINTQYPQNNYLGFQMIATDKLAQKIAGTSQSPAQKVQTTLNQGMGFLSPQTCPSNTAYNNGTNEFQKPSLDEENARLNSQIPYPDLQDCSKSTDIMCDLTNQATLAFYHNQLYTALAAWQKTNACPGGLVNTTPGSVAANQIFKALGSDVDKTVLGSMVEGSLTAILNTLLSHFLDQGLSAMSSAINPPPPADTWSYNGNTLDSPTSITTPLGTSAIDFNNPITQNVSFSADSGVNVNMSGGKAPYIISTPPNTTITNAQIFSGFILSLTGVTAGTTLVKAQDSSGKTVTINITVTTSAGATNGTGTLTVNPQNITIKNVGDTVTAPISGGNGTYMMLTGPDQSVAMVKVASATLAISAIGNGTTSIVIQDSSNPAQTFKVNITVGTSTTPLTATPQSVSANTGTPTSITISGGTAPYTLAAPVDATVATTTPISGATFTITGVANGQTAAIIQDSSSPVQFTTIQITIGTGVLP